MDSRLRLFNTLSRSKEDFSPLSDRIVTMYSCGPTVYNFAHIGNLRTYIFMDLARRVLKLNGYKLKGVLNITDVGHLVSDSDDGEDKMNITARKEGKTPEEIANFYTEAFMKDIKRLNISRPEIVAKATDHIKEMLDYVIALEKLGYAYQTEDGIYFDISKFEDYGKLSKNKIEDQKAGARVEVNDFKRNPADFALWKNAPKEHIMQWQSPWGMGYPGWHIECSAMAKKYLGKVFDIHTGGVDHIPIHHENEIAQSEALEGTKTVNYWLHGEFMLVDGGKMSKSLGNVYTVDDLEKRGFSPLDFRYFCLNAHYRKCLNFTFEGLEAAHIALERLKEQLYAHKTSSATTPKEKLDAFYTRFLQAANDDLNVPMALGVLWTMLKEPKSKDIYELAVKMDSVFGLDLDKVTAPTTKNQQTLSDIPDQILMLAEQRVSAKKAKDYKKADSLREEINKLGYALTDRPDGTYTLSKN